MRIDTGVAPMEVTGDLDRSSFSEVLGAKAPLEWTQRRMRILSEPQEPVQRSRWSWPRLLSSWLCLITVLLTRQTPLSLGQALARLCTTLCSVLTLPFITGVPKPDLLALILLPSMWNFWISFAIRLLKEAQRCSYALSFTVPNYISSNMPTLCCREHPARWSLRVPTRKERRSLSAWVFISICIMDFPFRVSWGVLMGRGAGTGFWILPSSFIPSSPSQSPLSHRGRFSIFSFDIFFSSRAESLVAQVL